MILRPGSGDVQISQGQSWPCMHFVRIQCDSVGPVEKLTHGSCQLFAKVDFGLPRADFLSRVDLDLEASRSFRPTPHTKIWGNFVQSYFVRILAYGTWLRSLINAPCLDWSRFGRSGQKTNTASCVYSAMIEGMRYKVYLLLQGLAGAPCYGYGQSSPCMHRASLGVDSGDPVRKQTRHHASTLR